MILIKQVIKYYLGLISHQHTTMVLVKVIPFICLKMTYPLSLFSIVVEQTLFFPLTEGMYTVKRNSDCRTMTTFVNHFLTQDYGSKGRPKVLQRFEVKSFCEILSLEKNYNNWANKWYLMGDH